MILVSEDLPRVLVVDDSAVVRETVSILLRTHGYEVQTAADAIIALQKIARGRPDVIVLDLEMPRMDGISFLHRLMQENPLPVVVWASLGGSDADLALRALASGAVAVLPKAELGLREFLNESAAELLAAVESATRVTVRRPTAAAPRPVALRAVPAAREAGGRLVAVGASTGGTEALQHLLGVLPAYAPPVAIVQHMPALFTRAFAERLNAHAAIEVREARDGEPLAQGCALLAPGDRHLVVRRTPAGYVAQLSDAAPVSRHRPSVDVLFHSVAEAAGPEAIGVLLTGMGADGAEGLLHMRRAGAVTLAQDEQTSVVFGMPKEAIARGAVRDVLPLSKIPEAILHHARVFRRAR